MRAAIYVRLSKETEASSSVERQTEEALRIVRSRGLEHEPARDLYVDSDLSGYKRATVRPGYEAMLGALDGYGVVIVWRLDRLYRRFTDLVGLMARLDEGGVELVSVSETLDTSTPIGQAIAGFLAAQAETESRNTSMRVESAQRWLRERGYWPGGPAPYGYKVERVNGHLRLALHEEEAPIFRELADRVLRGEALAVVLRDLEARGVRTRRGAPLLHSNASRLLHRPVNAGYLMHKGSMARTPEGAAVLVTDEPLLSPARWRDLEAELASRTSGKRRSPRESMLAGLVRCAECGTKMHANRRVLGGNSSYACPAKGEGRDCPGVAIQMADLEDYVTEAVLAYAAPEVVAAWNARRAGPSPDREALESRVEHLREVRRAMQAERREGLYAGTEGARAFAEEWATLADALDAALEALEAARTEGAEAPALLEGDLRARWPNLSTSERRTVVGYWLEAATISKARGRNQHSPGVAARISLSWVEGS